MNEIAAYMEALDRKREEGRKPIFTPGQLVKHRETGAIYEFEKDINGFTFLAMFTTQFGVRSRHALDRRRFEALTEEGEQTLKELGK